MYTVGLKFKTPKSEVAHSTECASQARPPKQVFKFNIILMIYSSLVYFASLAHIKARINLATIYQ